MIKPLNASFTRPEAAGEAGNPALVLIHPLGGRIAFWDECRSIWERRFPILACDLRGAGDSPVADRPWRAEDHARDVAALSARFGLDRMVVIGCAIGSLVAALLARQEAASVCGLVLSDTTPRLGEESRKRTQARIDRVLQQGIGTLLPEVVDMAFEAQPRDARYAGYLDLFSKNDPTGYAALATGMMGTDISAALAAITCPSLVIAGAHDRLLPPELSRQVHEILPNSEFHEIADAAHFPPYQRPQEFARLVEAFIDGRVLRKP